jgi:AAA+ superfamily predicted ATPase
MINRKTTQSELHELLTAFQWLDRLLEQAIATAQFTYGLEAATDVNRGLYIDESEVEHLLGRETGKPLFQVKDDVLSIIFNENTSRLSRLQKIFNLSDFDLKLVLIALAPEVDLRYERLYAYLQDDVTRKRPTIDLVFNLLCASPDEKLMRREHLAANAPLARYGLLYLIPDPNQVEPPFLSHYLRLDGQVIQFLLGQTGNDRRLTAVCKTIQPSFYLRSLPLELKSRQMIQELVTQMRKDRQPLTLYLQGLPGIGKQQIAEAIAHELNTPLLIADLVRSLHLKLDFDPTLNLIFLNAQLQNAVLYLPGMDQLRSYDQGMSFQRLLEKLAEIAGITILAGTQPWIPTTSDCAGVVPIALENPNFEQRRAYWQTQLAAASLSLDGHSLDVLASRFQLTPEQISSAVTTACHFRHCATTQEITLEDFFTAARAQSGHDLKTLADKIQSRYTWEEIVLPPDSLAQLKEICLQVKHRQVVYQEWGFDRKLSLGKGVAALFSGSSGTGKTMAAQVIANELQLDLYRIDLSRVVSKYIGETEKNLDRIFRAAETANTILFFDEADALFGKRSEVKDARDRYANIEIGYLLQKMEEYEGIVILATNLRQNLDDAFVRRIQMIVEFPFPDEEHRRYIWQRVFPKQAPIAEDVNFDILARQVRLVGGNIKNIALLAAFYAADTDKVIRWHHLVQAVRREYQKLGRSWNEVELDV